MHHEKEELEYDLFDHSISRPLYATATYGDEDVDYYRANAMNTRTFPKVKMEKYDPIKMAQSLAEARKHGATEEKEVPLHRQEHKHQTHSFYVDSHPDPLEEPSEKDAASEPTTTGLKEPSEEPKSMDLKPKEPKNIKHVVDLPVQDPPSDKKKSEKRNCCTSFFR